MKNLAFRSILLILFITPFAHPLFSQEFRQKKYSKTIVESDFAAASKKMRENIIKHLLKDSLRGYNRFTLFFSAGASVPVNGYTSGFSLGSRKMSFAFNSEFQYFPTKNIGLCINVNIMNQVFGNTVFTQQSSYYIGGNTNTYAYYSRNFEFGATNFTTYSVLLGPVFRVPLKAFSLNFKTLMGFTSNLSDLESQTAEASPSTNYRLIYNSDFQAFTVNIGANVLWKLQDYTYLKAGVEYIAANADLQYHLQEELKGDYYYNKPNPTPISDGWVSFNTNSYIVSFGIGANF